MKKGGGGIGSVDTLLYVVLFVLFLVLVVQDQLASDLAASVSSRMNVDVRVPRK